MAGARSRPAAAGSGGSDCPAALPAGQRRGRQANYAVNVKGITPDAFPGSARSAWCSDMGGFLAIFRILRRVVVRWSCDAGKILLTAAQLDRRSLRGRLAPGRGGSQTPMLSGYLCATDSAPVATA